MDNLTNLYKDCTDCLDELALLQKDHPDLEKSVETEVAYFDVAAAVKALEQVEIHNSTLNNVSIIEGHDTPKLPRIKLSDFDGSHDKWLAFKNIFVVLVHARTDISNVIKHAIRRGIK